MKTLKKIGHPATRIELSEGARERILTCREYLDKKISVQKEPIYGVTTGFGKLCEYNISHDDLNTLQRNLVMSHACGMGEEVSAEVVRLMLF